MNFYKDSFMDLIIYKKLRDRGWKEDNIKKLVIGQFIFSLIALTIGIILIIG